MLMCTMCALTSSSSRFSEVTCSFNSWRNGRIKRLLGREEREGKRREGGGRKKGRERGEGRVQRQKEDCFLLSDLLPFLALISPLSGASSAPLRQSSVALCALSGASGTLHVTLQTYLQLLSIEL